MQIILGSGNTAAQAVTTDPVQILDRVTATGRDFALDLPANDPDRVDDFAVLFESSELPAGTNLVDCTVSVWKRTTQTVDARLGRRRESTQRR